MACSEHRASVSHRILIVDDNDQLRDVVRAFLESRGFDVCGEVANDTEAIERAGELKPDLITMGLAMPLLNGTEAASVISQVLDCIKSLLG